MELKQDVATAKRMRFFKCLPRQCLTSHVIFLGSLLMEARINTLNFCPVWLRFDYVDNLRVLTTNLT